MPDQQLDQLAARQGAATAAFVELVNTLVDEFDVVELLTGLTARSVELLRASAAGILLADGRGTLRVMGASNEEAHLLELLQVQNDEGPCMDCYQSGDVISNGDLTRQTPWPKFAAASVAHGYLSVCAIPMRVKDFTMGCLNLFMTGPVEVDPGDIALARGLADVATIAIAQNRLIEDAAVREAQLQHALKSRTVIEQAKGMIAAQRGVDMDRAFSWLRNHARSNNRLLTDVANEIIAGTLVVASSAGTQTTSKPPPRPR
jgi:transcriptional regulator with GAF, ATPase, and Fis domain